MIFLINKPIHLTSAQVVSKIKKTFQLKKVGHCGTLDPLATGMLPICVGEGTKFSQYILSKNKKYRVGIKLGIKTDTYDVTGTILEKNRYNHISYNHIKNTLYSFIGKSKQSPPPYSAIKVKGKCAYKLARKGIYLDLAQRDISIHSIKIIRYEKNKHFEIDIFCSKGTYIRSLVNDLGNKLQIGATVESLHRLWVEPFDNHNMHHIEEITSIDAVSIGMLFDYKIIINEADYEALKQGKYLPYNTNNYLDQVALFNNNNQFLGIGRITTEGIKPVKIIQNIESCLHALTKTIKMKSEIMENS